MIHIHRTALVAVSVTFLALTNPQISLSAPTAETNDLAALRSEVNQLRTELNTTKVEVASLKQKFEELTAEPPAFTPVTVTLDKSGNDDFVLGDPNAPVTIMEFFDYLCGYCEMFHDQVFPEIKKTLIDTGKVRFIYRDFPISGEQSSVLAAAFADCAGKQGKYLPAHDALFQSYEAVAAGKVEEVANEIGGLDISKLKQCLGSPEYIAPQKAEELTPSVEMRGDIEEGDRIGIDGTPGFFVFKTSQAGRELTGQLIAGAQPLEVFQQVVALVQDQR